MKVKVTAIAGLNTTEEVLEFDDGISAEDIRQECLEYAMEVTGFEWYAEVTINGSSVALDLGNEEEFKLIARQLALEKDRQQ